MAPHVFLTTARAAAASRTNPSTHETFLGPLTLTNITGVSTLCLEAFNRYKDAKAAGALSASDLEKLYNEFMALSSQMNMLTLQVSGVRSKMANSNTGRPNTQIWLI
ncbi:hypothetical protein H072_3973 [Dactylellina haptotyla CBS 200.50]|uniref:Uncharacterized protein n=1 Tax=Dactylellina haptotyla (strain CBS 200.50) TaxID=1284197 RepID=S8AH28_DACHA|nr:hypothetical protein H072_3973 [Dactylellina haptotyla CBS 200.50]